ncbi:hypothetical protein JHK86_010208 [Glycine max]|nr:hypothetical protein JHK86_010208 [Glycine max]
MHYLYTILASLDLPHEYLKSNNVLVGPDNEPMLIDYEASHMYVSNGKGRADVVQWVETAISEGRESEVLDPKIAGSRNWLAEMEQLLHIGAACTESNPQQRLDLSEAIRRIMEIKFKHLLLAASLHNRDYRPGFHNNVHPSSSYNHNNILSTFVERNTLLGKVQILLYQSRKKHKIVGGTVLLVVGLYIVLWGKSKESVKEGVKGDNLEVEETKEETRLECIVQH